MIVIADTWQRQEIQVDVPRRSMGEDLGLSTHPKFGDRFHVRQGRRHADALESIGRHTWGAGGGLDTIDDVPQLLAAGFAMEQMDLIDDYIADIR